MTNLYAHQENLLLKNPKKVLLCWDTGTGKTRAALEYVNKNHGGGATLVVCPKALKENWKREAKKWGVEAIFVKTKEEFRRDWETLPYFNKLVIDEAHHFAGRKSQMSKNLGKYIKKHGPARILLLTATPYRSSPWDIFILAKHLGYYINYFEFEDQFFSRQYVGRGRQVPVVRDDIEEDIADIVRGFGDIVHIEDCADIPEQTFEVEAFPLTRPQEKLKKDTYDTNPIVRYTRHHEIENGVLVSDGYTPDMMNISCLKNERILELCEDNKKIIIVCRYNLQIDMLEELLSSKFKRPVYVIRGRVKNRDSVVQEAEAASEAIVLIQAACSEGYELPSYPVMVFASLDYSYVNYKQMLGRIQRLNKLKKNYYLHLVTNGIDTAVYNAIMKKQSFDLAIYARQNPNNTEETLFGEGLSD